MIKTGGENVSSTAIEEVILAAHPNVAEVAVIGLPHPVWQEAVTAIISPKPGKIVTAEEIIEYCKEKIATFKVPKKVIIREVLPKNNMGKILKRELKQIYAETFEVSP
jgi:fatty-acyl-CoA synthase